MTTPVTSDERITAIEDAFVAHWGVFGRWSHGSLHNEDGVLWFETPIAHLPYNMVMQTRIDSTGDVEAIINRIAQRFQARGVPYLWVLRPSDTPKDLGRRLAKNGLDHVETVTCMDLDLDDWSRESAPSTDVVEVDDDPKGLRDYVEMVRTYWSVAESAQHLLQTFNEEYSGARTPGIRLVARKEGAPVGKLFMNLTQIPDRVSIYGVAVKPEARGFGIATTLMEEALSRAVSLGARRCVLHSSEMAVSLYSRMGFTKRCTFSVFATGPLFGTHHH